MKKYIALILAGICLALAGCGNAPAPGSVGSSRPIAAYIGDYVTKVEVTHIFAGQTENWVAKGDDVESLRTWTAGLKYSHVEFAEGESPAEGEGAEVYSFALTEGDYPGFTYYCGDEDHSYLRIEGEWYKVSNPSRPPIDNEPNHDLAIEDIPQEPPTLFVVDSRNGMRTSALRGTYSWLYPNGDGTTTGIEADGASPLDCKELMPSLNANAATVLLTFAVEPSEIIVNRWTADSWGNFLAEAIHVDVVNGTVELEPDSNIYEVVATWNGNSEWGGTARYSFYSGPASELGRDMGVTFSVKDATSKGLTLVCTQSGGNPTGELETGAPFWLESYVNGDWEATPRDQIEVTFTMEAWTIPMNTSVEWSVNLEWLYPNLAPGKYRIGKEIMDFRGAGDFDRYTIYGEFEIN